MMKLPETTDHGIQRFCALTEIHLSDIIEAIYLYGSVALNAYVEGTSDIDFIAIVRRSLTISDNHNIAEMHRILREEMPHMDIMGAYVRREDLGKEPAEIPSILSYHDGRIDTEGSADLNPVTWWILRHRGVLIYGEDKPFRYEISPDSLVEYVRENMNSYWAGMIERLQYRLASPGLSEEALNPEQLDFAVQWCVLGMLRQLYTVREGGIADKLSAGIYGLNIIPARWHRLIREAVAIKSNEPEKRLYDSQLRRLEDLVSMLTFIRSEVNGHP